ncbi:MAG: hypothetical protein ACXADA_08660 [Candidatus Hodarchaeales archaeon]|jgi:hypothetical protein
MIEQEKVQFQFQFSRLSKISGLSLLLTILALVILVIGFNAQINDILFRVVVGLLIVEPLIFFLGLIKDRLTSKLATMGFKFHTFWAIVSYAGIMIVFLPIVLWIALNTLDFVLSSVLVSIGILVFFFGFFSETRDLNKNLTRSITAFIAALKSYEYQKGIKTFFGLIKQQIIDFISYLVNSALKLKKTVKNILSWTFNAPKAFIKAIVSLVQWIPSATARSIRMLLRHFEKIGLVASITLVYQSLIEPPSSLRVDFNLSFSLLVISVVLIIVKTTYLHKERFIALVVTVRDRTWETGYMLNYRLKTIGETRKKITCTNCGELISLNSRTCNKCDRVVERCIICKLPLEQGQEQASCLHCSKVAHHDHWRYWKTRKGSCPACLQEINI